MSNNQAMINNFKSLKGTSKVIFDNMQVDSQGLPNSLELITGYVVTSCFCCELGLKFQLIEEDTSYNRIHKLRDLFNLLKPSTRRVIYNHVGNDRRSPNNNFQQWFQSSFDEISNGFVDWRYSHEGGESLGDGNYETKTVTANLHFVDMLVTAIDSIIPPSDIF